MPDNILDATSELSIKSSISKHQELIRKLKLEIQQFEEKIKRNKELLNLLDSKEVCKFVDLMIRM